MMQPGKTSALQANTLTLLFAQTLSLMGASTAFVALIWHVTNDQEGAFLGKFVILSTIPGLASFFISAAAIQILNPKVSALVCDTLRAFLYFMMAIVMSIFQITNLYFITIAFMPVVLLQLLYTSSILTLPYYLGDKTQFNTITPLLEGNVYVSSLIGAPLGIYLYTSFHLRGLFYCLAVIYIMSAFVLHKVRLQNEQRIKKKKSISIKETLIQFYIIAPKYKIFVIYIIALSLFALFTVGLQIFIPSYVKHIYQINGFGLSQIENAAAMGGLLAVLLVYKWPLSSLQPWKKILIPLNFSCFSLMIFAQSNSFYAGLVSIFFTQFFFVLSDLYFVIHLQTTVSKRIFPSFISFFIFLMTVNGPLGTYLAGQTLSFIPLQTTCTLWALICMGISLTLICVRTIREI